MKILEGKIYIIPMAYPQSLERAEGYYSSFFFVGIKYATEILETDTFSQKILQKKKKKKKTRRKRRSEGRGASNS